MSRMAKAGIEVERYIESGMLKMLPWESVYASKEKFDAPGTLESLRNVISEMIGNTKAKGIIAIGSVDVLIKHGEQERVVEYEKSIGKRFQTPTEAVCCYNADSLSDFSVSVLIDILNAHQYIIHDNAEYSEWEGGKLQTVMTSAFSKVMGTTTSDLVLKTLKSIYMLDGKSVISQPEILENVVGKFFKDSAPPILAAVVKDLKSEVAFHRQSA